MSDQKIVMARLSADSVRLEKRLCDVAVGQIVTYQELSAVASRNVTRAGRGVLATAIRRMRNIHKVNFETIRGVGIKRTDSHETIACRQHDIKRIHRAAGRSSKRFACAKLAELNSEQRCQASVIAAQIATIRATSSVASQRLLEAKMGEAAEREQLSLNAALDAIKRSPRRDKSSRNEISQNETQRV